MKDIPVSRDLSVFACRLAELMPRLMRAMLREERNALSRGEVTVPQIWMMDLLKAHGPMSMSALAEGLGIGPSAVTGFADRLVGQGFVRRLRDACDRRRVRLEITARGARILRVVEQDKRRAVIRAFSVISPLRRRQYLSVLEELASKMTAVDGKAGNA